MQIFGITASSGSRYAHWIGQYFVNPSLSAGTTQIFNDVPALIDSSNNMYILPSDTSNRFSLEKYSANSGLVFDSSFNFPASSNGEIRDTAFDSSNNINGCGYLQNSSTSNVPLPLLLKYSNAGTQLSSKLYNVAYSSTPLYGFFNQIAIDSSGNVITGGQIFNTSSSLPYGISSMPSIVQFNSSGTVNWSNSYYFPGGTPPTGPEYIDGYVHGITIDGSNNIYTLSVILKGTIVYSGGVPTSSTTYAGDFIVTKYNSSGTVQWQKSVFSSSAWPSFTFGTGAIVADSSGNTYVFFSNSTGGRLIKLNTSGTFINGVTLPTSPDPTLPSSLALDASGNVYLSSGTVYTKFSPFTSLSAGALWQRSLGLRDSVINVDALGNYMVTGTSASIAAAVFAKLPGDGSLTGTYNVSGHLYAYTTYSESISSYTPTITTPTYSTIGLTYTSTTTGLTNGSATNTYNSLTIG